MKIFKSRVFAFILGAVIFSTISVYAVTQIQASNIGYNEGTVQDAIDELYRVKGTGVQVATITTQGGTYTMQNDGYITGTMAAQVAEGLGAVINLNGVKVSGVDYRDSSTLNVSIYAAKGTVVTTRSDGGTYNLTVYEWK